MLGIPLVLVLLFGNTGCTSSSLALNPLSICHSSKASGRIIEFLPFLMIIGGVLIAYNMKKISDSFLPEKDLSDEENEEEQEDNDTWSAN
jgi:hypothetical protein